MMEYKSIRIPVLLVSQALLENGLVSEQMQITDVSFHGTFQDTGLVRMSVTFLLNSLEYEKLVQTQARILANMVVGKS